MKPIDWLSTSPIAHRGFHDAASGVIENTLGAFKRAIDARFAIECDLQYAADGVPVVFHDDDLGRLCAIGGDVRSKLSSELTQIAVGGTRERIPTLDRLLETVAGAVPLVIELKGRKGDDDGFAATVLDALDTYDGPVALMSFNPWLLEELKALDARFPIGLTAEGTDRSVLDAHAATMAQGLDFISYNVAHLPNSLIERLRNGGVPIVTWTVRDTAGVERTRRYGDQMTFEGFDPRDSAK